MQGLRKLSEALCAGDVTATELVSEALNRARASRSVFIRIDEGIARHAQTIDRARAGGQAVPALAGIPIALKDLFNVRDEVTLAGSLVRRHHAKPESRDAEVVAFLRDAGLLFLGRANMSEFAFSGIGKNPHYGTPSSIWDRATGRLPGGSSSGSGVSVAEGIVPAALGTDTAGSCRIPAAFNAVVGVKPSHGRMSLKGVYPLSPTLDAPGPLAVDVDSCFLLDQLMCARMKPRDPLPILQPAPVESLKLVVPEGRVTQDLDDEVREAFVRAVSVLGGAGACIERLPMPVLDDCVDFFAGRSLVLYEAWAHHRGMLEQYPDEYDAFVSQRIRGGAEISEAEQQYRYRAREQLVESFNHRFDRLGADALIYPTVACVPPAIAETEDEARCRQINLHCLRNTATVNTFNGCAISLPCHRQGEAPAGLMVSAKNGSDEFLYRIAAAIEALIRH